MKKITILLMVIVMMIAFTGCHKVVNTNQFEADVLITDTHHKPLYVQRMKVGKTYTYITHSAQYLVYVEYQGVEYIIDNEEDYKIAKNHHNKTLKAKIEEAIYDDGTTEVSIKELIKAGE